MDKPTKAAIRTGSIFGGLGALAIIPFAATPVAWLALAYGTYYVAKTAYYEEKFK
jgi:hypothetical protein